jgi:hypothetical protein
MGEQGLDWTGMAKGIKNMDEYQKYMSKRTAKD